MSTSFPSSDKKHQLNDNRHKKMLLLVKHETQKVFHQLMKITNNIKIF